MAAPMARLMPPFLGTLLDKAIHMPLPSELCYNVTLAACNFHATNIGSYEYRHGCNSVHPNIHNVSIVFNLNISPLTPILMALTGGTPYRLQAA